MGGRGKTAGLRRETRGKGQEGKKECRKRSRREEKVTKGGRGG